MAHQDEPRAVVSTASATKSSSTAAKCVGTAPSPRIGPAASGGCESGGCDLKCGLSRGLSLGGGLGRCQGERTWRWRRHAHVFMRGCRRRRARGRRC